ncbi:MAG: hypothetical protein Q9184_002755 [Pyrenodesmia sp. 2 TL-2023]
MAAVGTELTNSQASVILWDLKATRLPVLEYVESHSDDVTDLSFHPANPSIVLSGSTDGLVNLYDTATTDEDDALIHVFNHGSSIAHAGFLSEQELYALSSDENFSICETGDVKPDGDYGSTHAFGDLRPQLLCDAQSLDLVPLRKQTRWSLDTLNALHLPGAHGDAIVRSICFNDDHSTVFTAGEDGLIKAWRLPAEADRNISTKEAGNISKNRKKPGSPEEVERARFKPY